MDIQAVSVVPGRIRFRIPQLKQNPDAARDWERRLQGIEGIREVAANPLTGTLLIRYGEEGLGWDKLVSGVLPGQSGKIDRRMFLLSAAKTGSQSAADPNEAIANIVHGMVRGLNTVLESATGGVNLRSVAPLAFLVFGMSDLLLSERVARAPWFTLLWYAMSTFDKYNPSPDEGKEAGKRDGDVTLLEGAG